MTDAGVAEPVPREPRARRYAIAWGVVALGLVTIVAMAAHGAAWSGDRGGDVRTLPHAVTLAGAVVAFCVAIVLILLVLARAGVPETAEQRRRRWMVAIVLLVVLALVSILSGLFHPSNRAERDVAPASNARGHGGSAGSVNGGHPAPTTWWPLVIVSLGTAGALFVAIARRKGAPTPTTDADEATIALLDASLDDLRNEPDPRRAVVAAYARMERALAARGLSRDPAATPTEYLSRVREVEATSEAATLPAVTVRALAELTALAERARFSPLEVDEAMRTRAIDALQQLRDELRLEVDTKREATTGVTVGRVV